jgi:hypothetical protein
MVVELSYAVDRVIHVDPIQYAIVPTVLRRGRSVSRNPLCYQYKDTHDLVTPMNGRTFLGKERYR